MANTKMLQFKASQQFYDEIDEYVKNVNGRTIFSHKYTKQRLFEEAVKHFIANDLVGKEIAVTSTTT